MRRSWIFLSCTLVLLLVASARAELDKKQAGLLSRTGTQLTNLDGQLDRYVANPGGYTERVDGDMKRKVEKQEEALKTLPADEEDVKKELAHLDAVKAKLASVSGKLSADKSAKADEKEGIVKLLTAPEFAADLEAAKNAAEMFLSSKRYEFDHYVYARWQTHEMIEEMAGWSEGWPATKKKHAELVAKYEKAVAYKSHLEGDASRAHTDMLIALREAKERFPAFESAVTTFAKTAPAQIEKEIAALKAASKIAVEKQDFQAFTLWEADLSQHRNRVVNTARIWAPLASSPEERARVQALVKKSEAEVEVAAEKLTEVIVRENRAPANAFKGDRAELEKYVRGVWAKKFPAESILAVRFPSEAFERQTSWNYRPDLNGFAKVDRSSMRAWVIVKDGAKGAIMWPVGIYKLHLKGDSLELNWADRPSKPPPTQRLLLANFK